MYIHTYIHTNSPTITHPSLSYFLFPCCFSVLSLIPEKLLTCGVIRSYNFFCLVYSIWSHTHMEFPKQWGPPPGWWHHHRKCFIKELVWWQTVTSWPKEDRLPFPVWSEWWKMMGYLNCIWFLQKGYVISSTQPMKWPFWRSVSKIGCITNSENSGDFMRQKGLTNLAKPAVSPANGIMCHSSRQIVKKHNL